MCSPANEAAARFIPSAFNQTLLLLHGTGGYERDLIPLGGELDLFIGARLDLRRTLRVRRASLGLFLIPELSGKLRGARDKHRQCVSLQ